MEGKSSPSASSASPGSVGIKKEAPEEEVKEFAETAMDELLGWYGYERLELRRWAAAAAARDQSPDSTNSAERKDKDECSWCNNPITTDSALHQSGAKFCSELCFSQSRRANFKRAKTCDWCRHVRHTVAYVDFQDGATQLQFCSDKCLNQYKMHIFCRETQAHLDLNPHLAGSASTSNLITPELWLKNCRSRSTSPTSEKTPSPAAENLTKNSQTQEEKPDLLTRKKSPLPIITIAPTSKLLKAKHPNEERIAPQTAEQKRDLRSSKLNLRKRRGSRCSSTVTSQILARQSNATSTAKPQDLRTCSPPANLDTTTATASSVGNSSILSPPQQLNSHQGLNLHPHNFPNPMFSAPPPMFMDGIPQNLGDPRFPRMFHPPNFMPRPGMFSHERPRIPPPMQFPQMAFGQPPPVTILVPYPVPIPLPIPIPIPLASMMQAFNLRRTPKGDSAKPSSEDGNAEGPLDFTMNVDRKKRDEDPPEEANAENEKKENTSRNISNSPDGSENIELASDSSNLEQTLPRFKITRLGSKIAKVVTKPREPPESSRPLRKRRRLVEVHTDEDCSPLLAKSRKIVQV